LSVAPFSRFGSRVAASVGPVVVRCGMRRMSGLAVLTKGPLGMLLPHSRFLRCFSCERIGRRSAPFRWWWAFDFRSDCGALVWDHAPEVRQGSISTLSSSTKRGTILPRGASRNTTPTTTSLVLAAGPFRGRPVLAALLSRARRRVMWDDTARFLATWGLLCSFFSRSRSRSCPATCSSSSCLSRCC